MYTVYAQYADGGCDAAHVTSKKAATAKEAEFRAMNRYARIWTESGKHH